MDESIFPIIAFLIFAVVGYLVAKKLPEPKRGFVWVIWLAILVISGYIGMDTQLVNIMGASIFLNNCLQGLIFGLLSSWLMKRYLLP